MGVLQQVKSERGTMAGMSIEDIRQQVEQRLAQNERPVKIRDFTQAVSILNTTVYLNIII